MKKLLPLLFVLLIRSAAAQPEEMTLETLRALVATNPNLGYRARIRVDWQVQPSIRTNPFRGRITEGFWLVKDIEISVIELGGRIPLGHGPTPQDAYNDVKANHPQTWNQ